MFPRLSHEKEAERITCSLMKSMGIRSPRSSYDSQEINEKDSLVEQDQLISPPGSCEASISFRFSMFNEGRAVSMENHFT